MHLITVLIVSPLGAPYNYSYEVKDEPAGLNFGQNENSDGSVVSGEYRVLLPDGRTQIVRYDIQPHFS